MDAATAQRLCEVTNAFYRTHGASFSQTRQGAWPGWKTCFDVLERRGFLNGARRRGALSVFDMACGNLRFEAYAAFVLHPLRPTFYAVDNCDALARGLDAPGAAAAAGGVPAAVAVGASSAGAAGPDAPAAGARALGAALAGADVRYQGLDVLRALQGGASLQQAVDAPSCDLSVAFGFLHHVPGHDRRVAVLRALAGQTRPGGYMVASFWRFLHDAAFAAKARAEHERAAAELGLPPLDAGDFVLGWQNRPGAFRYCHHFSDAELDLLSAALEGRAREAACFRADGRTGAMNAYVVWQVQ